MDIIRQSKSDIFSLPEISDEDVYEAMKEISGYLDISPSDFRELYIKAGLHAVHRHEHAIKAKDIMTCRVITVNRDADLADVAEILAVNSISGLPVIDIDGKIAGVISEKDFLIRLVIKESTSFMSVIAECLANNGCLSACINAHKAEDIMTSPPITCKPNLPLYRLAEIMSSNNINRLPVTDDNNRPVGIITRSDLVKAYTLRMQK